MVLMYPHTSVPRQIQQIGITIPPKVTTTPIRGQRELEQEITHWKPKAMAMEEQFTQDQEEGSTTTTIVEERFMSQNNRFNFFVLILILGFPISVCSQSYFSDQYAALARDFKNESEARQLRFKSQIDENIESYKYIGKKYFDFYAEQMLACQNSKKIKKSLSKEDQMLLDLLKRNYSEVESISDLGIRNIENKVNLTDSSFNKVCPPASGDFNGYIECVTRLEKYRYQVNLKFEASLVKVYFYELLSDPIGKLNQCILSNGYFDGMNLNSSNKLMGIIKDEVDKIYLRINKVATGLM